MSEPDASPWVSLLLVCHNDGKWLPRCLESIRHQTIFSHLEVIIADNDSRDGTEELARALICGWSNAELVRTGGDNGFCIGTNVAAKSARAKYLYVLNPDTWLERDCVEELHRHVEQKRAGAGGPTILDYDGSSVQSECADGYDFCGNLMQAPARSPVARPFSAGGFFFIRRDLFTKLGGLDAEFFMYSEEQDLAWRIWLSGEHIVSVPSARIHHRGAVGINPEGGTKPVENRTNTQKRFLANRNRLLVIAKNCRGPLLLMFIPCAAVLVLEGLVTLLATRSWELAKAGCLSALLDLWRLRGHIRKERRRIASFRRRGDLWMLRFFRFGFGRWEEIGRILKAGFPKFR